MFPGLRLSTLLGCIFCTLPLAAQHGVTGPGLIHGPAFSGHSNRAPVAPVPRFGSGLPSFAPPNFRPVSPSTAAALRRVPTLTNPAQFTMREGRFGGRERRLRSAYAPVLGWGLPWNIGWIPDVLDYPDAAYPEPAPVPAYSADPVQASAPPPVAQPEQQAQESAFRASYVRSAPPPPEPAEMEPVTLVFKDGRPNEQVRNYMITRRNLYIHDGHMQVIPIDEIDVQATQKANQQAGIDFQVPGQS